MLHEDLRFIHEDIERLEQGIADRVLDDPKHIRNRLARDHEIANLLEKIRSQSEHALQIYNDQQDVRTQEVQSLSTGDPFEEFYKQLGSLKEFHKRNANEPVENLERAYKKLENGGPSAGFAGNVGSMFTGEEAFGKFFDLTLLHEEYQNLPGVKGVRRLTYLQYLDIFDNLTPPQCPLTRKQKMTDAYFSYVGSLAQYLESFMRKTKPLEDLDKLLSAFDAEFDADWEDDKVAGWESKGTQANSDSQAGPMTEGTGEGIWCADCEKEFNNDNVYKGHLAGKKHIKNAEAKRNQQNNGAEASTDGTAAIKGIHRLKEKAIAERENRIRKVAGAMQTVRTDTRVNVERKFGMTDRERQQEIDALYAEDDSMTSAGARVNEEADDDDEKVYNPLKLPLAWDGKPIPFWLYKLHGLGVEFSCEICGNYVYMGRRAFEKHFSEARHVYGLKCLGVTNTSLFREITTIEEAEKLWEKIQRDKSKESEKEEDIVEMEDSTGHVMPQKVYWDLVKEGIA